MVNKLCSYGTLLGTLAVNDTDAPQVLDVP
jgi:hypothetical protein